MAKLTYSDIDEILRSICTHKEVEGGSDLEAVCIVIRALNNKLQALEIKVEREKQNGPVRS